MKTKLTKMIMSSLALGCASVCLAAAMAVGTSATAQSAPDGRACSVHTLHGSYLFATHGWNIVGGVAQPKAIVEGIDFNGDGTLVSPFATVSINGTILHSSGSLGTYTVNTDCTGTLSFTGGASFDIFVEQNGKQLWMIQTGPGSPVFEGTVTRVP
ncbi:MAG: hypothetical protein DME98_02870 [Verrucomicrobia bacterium]|jgi:hypothetical protein|nr:MAG: hypothetical protein DME98_02870 [Verrucomicrobiota bacterium]